MIPLIVIEGATATGKSQLAFDLALKLKTEIISADSRQVYRYLNIGTAKPSADLLNTVKHHLIDIIDPSRTYNAGLFVKQAENVIRELNIKGKIPIICGGTGLYVKSLLEGLFAIDDINPSIRQQLETELSVNGLESLYILLQDIDPLAASNIKPNDSQRILRALEVHRATGKTISEHWQNQKTKKTYAPYQICLQENRDVLYQRIDDRVDEMLQEGLLDEISAVLAKGYKWSDPGFNSVGYKEFQPFMEDTDTLHNCLKIAQQHTRNYAKRQMTWYRKCKFNLSEPLNSININNVLKSAESYFRNL